MHKMYVVKLSPTMTSTCFIFMNTLDSYCGCIWGLIELWLPHLEEKQIGVALKCTLAVLVLEKVVPSVSSFNCFTSLSLDAPPLSFFIPCFPPSSQHSSCHSSVPRLFSLLLPLFPATQASILTVWCKDLPYILKYTMPEQEDLTYRRYLKNYSCC